MIFNVLDVIMRLGLGICAFIACTLILIYIFTYPVVFFVVLFVFSLAYGVYYLGGLFHE